MDSLIKIETVKGSSDRELLVKDKAGISLARLYTLEGDRKRKSMMIRLKPLKSIKDDELYEMLTRVFRGYTRGGEINKISFITPEDINISPFTRLGFSLEGVLRENNYNDSDIRDELVFGASHITFGNLASDRELIIEGERIVLKQATPEDAEDYLKYQEYNREFLKKFEPVKEDSFYTLEGQREELKERYHQYLNGLTYSFGIYLKGELIGKIRVSGIIMGSFRNAILGYSLHKDHLNRGYMTEAVNLAANFCYKELGLHRVEASTLLDNAASQKVLLNNGFVELGVNRNYLFINGQWRDHKNFYMTQEMYQEYRKGK